MANEPLSLKFRAMKAFSWTFAGFAVLLVIRLLGNLVIARLLTPDVFGIMAVCTAIQVIVALTGDIGLRQAVIRSENGNDPKFLNTAWTVQILRGFTIWVGCGFVAIIIYLLNLNGAIPQNSVYADPILTLLIPATSFSTVILSFQSMKVISLGRSLDLRKVTIIDLFQAVVGLLVAIGLAWEFRSVWAFVVSGLVTSLVSVVAGHVWLSGPRDQLGWDREALRELMHFGKWSSISSFLGVIAMTSDRLLLGGWLSPANLGHYSIASNLSSVADSIGTRIFGNVFLPALSELNRKQPGRLREVFFRMRRGADASYVCCAGFLFAAGDAIISALYDVRYAEAGPMLQILSFGLLIARYSLAQDAYIALGKPNYLTALNVVRLVSLFSFVPVMYYFFGTIGAIFGIALYSLPTIPLILWLNEKHGLNNIKFEFQILILWPVGWLIGKAASSVLDTVVPIMKSLVLT